MTKRQETVKIKEILRAHGVHGASVSVCIRWEHRR